MNFHFKYNMKKCKICNKEFEPYRSTQKVCSFECAIELSNSETQRNFKKKVAFERKKFNYENLTLSDWKKKVQTVFNKFIRLRDINKGCVSCGVSLQNRKFDAGHFYPSTYEGLRFNEFNVHGQCVPCNREKHGNIHEYRKRILTRITQEDLDWLDANRNIKLKLSKNELEDLFIHYTKKVKHEQIKQNN